MLRPEKGEPGRRRDTGYYRIGGRPLKPMSERRGIMGGRRSNRRKGHEKPRQFEMTVSMKHRKEGHPTHRQEEPVCPTACRRDESGESPSHANRGDQVSQRNGDGHQGPSSDRLQPPDSTDDHRQARHDHLQHDFTGVCRVTLLILHYP